MKRIILIRHGETEKNKNKVDRKLTEKGKSQISLAGKKLKKYCVGLVVIYYSDAVRAQQTAQILANKLGVSQIIPGEFRIKNIENISSLISNSNKRPAKIYLELNDYAKWGIEPPHLLIERWLSIFKSDFETVILVGHEASLEGFLYNQKNFKLLYKSFRKYFNYGDFAVLTEKE